MKRNASKPDGTVPLMGRITIDGTISQFSGLLFFKQIPNISSGLINFITFTVALGVF
ncbi:MAG: hypothetical protein LBL58_01880 [Tannerellaceae bacterium]|nr:hypothetical protein [Tannerellaceae bacterium]